MMNSVPDPEDQKRRVLATFNGMAATYDTLTFVQVSARRVLELVDLQPGVRVLDVGTGTGLVVRSDRF
jgi:ubiquinone/menaquinone biosynthesis C-methylase UbiE